MKQNCDIRTAVIDDLGSIKKLLLECSLPVEGLDEHLDTILVICRDHEVIGCAALELYGKSAFLRSVAVRPGFQGKGLGQGLTEAALDLARRNKVEEIYLLTETAGKYFSRFGFEAIDRRNVAHPVLQSIEFTTLCPKTAIAMKLRLGKALGKNPDNG